jgi:uncharacterized protein
MPVTPTYPGVYIEEIPSGVRTIVGVATSITAFIGIASQGRVNYPVRIQSFGDFERQFGGLSIQSALGYAVQQYFLNGGTDALIIRVASSDAQSATASVGGITLTATSPGKWIDNKYKAKITYPKFGPDAGNPKIFNLQILQEIIAGEDPIVVESFRNLSSEKDSPRYAKNVLEQDSTLVDITGNVPENGPTEAEVAFNPGTDGANNPTYGDYIGNEALKTGLYALEKADLFNLLCIPPNSREAGNNVADDAGQALLTAAKTYCKKRRAILIIDPPTKWDSTAKVVEDLTSNNNSIINQYRDENTVIYFPRIKAPDLLRENRLEEFPPCGVVAGIMARTDANRGVWKAPAGIEATLSGVRQLSYPLTDGENGQLNPLGVNCLRSFPVYGNVVWGARTLEGADQLASEWKYLPVRRLTLFMQESLYRGTQWVVFEPNDEPLWSQIRLNVGAFMNNLFRQGAFQGKTPREAYFVKCDSETTTQNDINLGIVNIVVGFAPLKPAEFVIIKFQQIAGQINT